jgi:putative ABC transport system permease protein
MLAYYGRLALNNLASTPGLTALMVLAIGLGIGVCVTILTVYHGVSSNPLWWKEGRVYAVTMDSWSPTVPAFPERPHLPPPQMTYMDATYLLSSDIPTRKVIMHPVNGVVSGGVMEGQSLKARTRVTTGDFFAMFDVPFLHGSAWTAQADAGPEPVIVLSRALNERLFAGESGVGQTIRWNDREFRVVGVLNDWQPLPKFYDMNTGPFDDPEDAYIPWGWSPVIELRTSGTTRCWGPSPIDTYEQMTTSDCVWIQMWVELPNAQARERLLSFMDAYREQQRAKGRFQRPKNNRLTTVGEWLADQEIVHDDNRLLVRLAFAFLLVCLINTAGLLLAKFLNGAAASGVRRALGASRLQIFAQHFVETGVLALAGCLVGLLLSALGLWGLRTLYAGSTETGSGYAGFAHLDVTTLIWALVLAVITTFLAGTYPAWRIGRVPPTVYLKSQ